MISDRRKLALAFALAGFLVGNLFAAEEKSGGNHEATQSTDEGDADNCRIQLNIIHGALREYYNDEQKFPLWLSDLLGKYIHKANTLVCPFVHGTGNVRNWRKGLKTFRVYDDPKPTSYGYEFCTVEIHEMPGTTVRQYKLRQMQVLGGGVPVVRCLAHTRPLNLTWDGSIYRSGQEWEDIFVRNTDDQKVLHAPLVDAQEAVEKLVAARAKSVDARCVDLSPYYNATLFHLSKIEYDGKLVECVTNGVQDIGGVKFDIRGLVHGRGAEFPVPFPAVMKGIAIDQKGTRVNILHGVVGEAAPGSEVASFTFHLENGAERTLPVAYGTNVKNRWFDSNNETDESGGKAALISLGANSQSSKALRLYMISWNNPEPNVKIRSVDFRSAGSAPAPFVVGITVE